MTKVEQFKVKNQFVIHTNEGTMFQSYKSPIALITHDGVVHLSEHWDYSRTTMKYLGQFLDTNAKGVRDRIKEGRYKLDLSLTGDLVTQ